MAGENLVLYVAAYGDPAAATADFKDLKEAQATEEFDIVSSVVMSRDDDGKVTVKETGGGQVGAGALVGGGVGLVVGLFAPPLLLSAVVGGTAGAAIGELAKRHDEKKLGVDVEEYLPPGTSAIVAILDDIYLDRIDRALQKADKKVSKAIDSGDYEKMQKAADEAGDEIAKALMS